MLLLVKPETLLIVTLHHGYFSRFLNCINDIKPCKASHIVCEVEGETSVVKMNKFRKENNFRNLLLKVVLVGGYFILSSKLKGTVMYIMTNI